MSGFQHDWKACARRPRVVYYSIKPGQTDAFWKDIRENFKPIYDEFKQAGYITDYKFWYNPTLDHPGDWDVALAILYPNWAAMDELDAKGMTLHFLFEVGVSGAYDLANASIYVVLTVKRS